MLSRRSRWIGALVPALALAVGVCGCWNPFNPDQDDGKDPDPIEIVDRTSKVNLVQFFAKAHEDQDTDDYTESLHTDYQFWFSEDDRNDPLWDWSDWIGKEIDVGITDRMFQDEQVTDIRVDFVNQTAANSQNPEDNFFEVWIEGDPPFTVYQGEFLVDMHVIEDNGEERIDHWVDGRAYIFFIPDPIYEGQWQIWKIEDKGNEHKKAGRSTSWGNLKREMR